MKWDGGVVTCLAADIDPAAGSASAMQALVDEGAAVVLEGGTDVVGAFRRVSDAIRAIAALRSVLAPGARIGLSCGETNRGGEFSAVADQASRLAHEALPGSTLLSKVAANFAVDHLGRDRRLHPHDSTYELVELGAVAS